MLTHMCTFEQGLETSPAECLPVECGQSDDATGTLYRKDRVSQSALNARLGNTGASGQWQQMAHGTELTGHYTIKVTRRAGPTFGQ